MLDARPEPARMPALARRSERIEHRAVGGVSDRVHREVEARVGAAARELSQLLGAQQRLAEAGVGERRRASQAVREPSVPSANALTGPMRSQSSPRPLRRPSATISPSRSAGSDAQTRSVRLRAPFSRCQAASPPSRWKSWIPVSPRACASRMPFATAVSSSRSSGAGIAAAASQAAVSRRMPVGLPDASRSTTGAVPTGSRVERRRREPGRVVIVRPEQHRTVAAGGVECLAVRRRVARRPAVRAPARAEHPAVGARGGVGRGGQHLRVRPRRREVEPPERERPLEEVHVGVREARHDAAAAQIDALVRDERAIALAHVDAPSDAVARDRDRARERKPGIAGAHAAVVEDHAAEGSPRRRSSSLSSARAPAPASGRGDRTPSRGVPGRPGAGRARRRPARAGGRSRLSQRHGPERAPRRARERRAGTARAARPRARARRERARPGRAVHVAARAAGGAGLGRPARAVAPRPRARRAPGGLLPALPAAPARSRDGRLHAGAVVGALAQERVGARAHPRRLRSDEGRDRARAGAARPRHARVRRARRGSPTTCA